MCAWKLFSSSSSSSSSMKTRLGISFCEMSFSAEELQTCEQNVCGMQPNVHGP